VSKDFFHCESCHWNSRIAQKRDQAISIDVNAKLSDKKMNKKDKDERVLWVKNEVADYEATTFSIFYNNCLFLLILLIASFFVFKNFSPVL
jgi:translocon-associated protein subunit gamma